MTLVRYEQKRDLKKSGEPKAKEKLSKEKKSVRFSSGVQKKIVNTQRKGRLSEGNHRCPRKLIYLIHKHYASHLHWDLRLEMQGVLKSWAVPKIPPKTKGIKRLAIQVEDHPLAYAKFKGTIPEGNYGAGKVEIWDKGTYEILEKNSNSITINIDGKKLKGKYFLVKTNFQGKKNNWLFFKG